MAETHTVERIQAQHVSALGSEVGTFWYAFRDELIRLYANWQQYRGLFGAAERVEFLSKLVGFFSLIVQDALWNEVRGWRPQSNRPSAIDNPLNRLLPLNNRPWVSCPIVCSLSRAGRSR